MQKIKLFKDQEGFVLSIRVFNTGFDLLYRRTIKFIQFGKVPVRFIVLKPKDKKFPRFIRSLGWIINKETSRICYGFTHRPLDISIFWRKNEELVQNRQTEQARKHIRD